ncbi:MAG: oligopeptide transporter, OPT family [Planctomycetota bacterium]|nr:MAG: oligopeptide transporter, OPT family [Planctomycetota bacterium]
MSDPVVQTRLPENAYRELKPGETYVPMVPAAATVPEVTGRSIAFGIVMNVIFSMAATYLALKVGQGIETAIPISILAVGLSGFLLKLGHRRSSLLENVNILALSTTSGIVAGGTVFTMPAIYLLGLDKSLEMSKTQLFLQISLVPLMGAVLGVVFLVPFRGYFVRIMHGKLPFPEATATNEILATGAAGDSGQAWVLIKSFALAVAYNFLSVAMQVFSKVFTTGHASLTIGKETLEAIAIPKMHGITEKVKAVFHMETSAAFLGLGFIIGLKYATIICCGSFLSCFVLVPLMANFDLPTLRLLNSSPGFADTSAESIFFHIPRTIGIGGIFAAGLISILKMSKVIATALKEALGGLIKGEGRETAPARIERDISYPMLLVLGVVVTVVMFLYFRNAVLDGMPGATRLTIIATILALVLSFLFTTVSAWAIAMISTTPLSGMTVTTIIITAVVLLQSGLPKGNEAMLAVLLVGGVVCTALSMAGTMVTQFKIGYWIGSTPRTIQWGGIISAILASALVTVTIMVLAHHPGYLRTPDTPEPLSAPQANLMRSTLESFLGTNQEVPWLLYGTGAVLSIIVNFLGVSPLAFMLGMYLPMGINTPILLGAVVQAMVNRKSGDEKLDKARNDRGVLVASGLIAGAAIIDVLINIMMILDEPVSGGRIMPFLDVARRLLESGMNADALVRMSNWLGLLAFAVLCGFVYFGCRRARPQPEQA